MVFSLAAVDSNNKNLVQLTDLTHFSGRRQLLDLDSRKLRRLRRLCDVDVKMVSHGIVRIRTSTTDRLVRLASVDTVELQGRKLVIRSRDSEIVLQNQVEACLVYSKLNLLLEA